MLIDVPVSIGFNADTRKQDHSAFWKTLTLRFDPTNWLMPVMLADHYPPRENAQFAAADEMIGELFPAEFEAKILALALADPESYYVDPEQAKVRLVEIEREEAARVNSTTEIFHTLDGIFGKVAK